MLLWARLLKKMKCECFGILFWWVNKFVAFFAKIQHGGQDVELSLMFLFKCRCSAPKDEDSVPEVKASEEDRSVDDGNKSGARAFRFKPATTPDDLAAMTMKNFAETTDKKIAWAAKLFNDWRQNRLKTSVDDSRLWNISWCNIDCAQDLNKSHLAYSLCSFLNEVR